MSSEYEVRIERSYNDYTMPPYGRRLTDYELKFNVVYKQIREISAGDLPPPCYNNGIIASWILNPEVHDYLIKKLSEFGEVEFISFERYERYDACDTYLVNGCAVKLKVEMIEDDPEYYITVESSNKENFEKLCNIVREMIKKKYIEFQNS